METLVKNRLVHLIERSEYPVDGFAESQAGFRKGRSAEEQLARVATAIHNARVAGLPKEKDGGNHCMLLLFDLEKAFDRVDHDVLLQRLDKKGVPQKFLLWIRAFLRKRKACVDAEGHLSEEFPQEIGLPQGTVLGPLLFLALIDELADRLGNIGGLTISLFADDIAIVVEGATLRQMNERAQAAVDVVENWASETGMKVAMQKTQAVYFAPLRMTAAGNLRKVETGRPAGFVTTHFGSTSRAVTVSVGEARRLAQALDNNLCALSGAMEASGAPELAGMRLVGVSSQRFGIVHTVATKADLLGMLAAEGSLRVHFALPVPLVRCASLLGVQFNEDLDFSGHVDQLKVRALKRLNLLRRVSGTAWGYSGEALRALYVSLVLSLYSYGIGVWGNFITRSCLKDLERNHAQGLCYALGLHPKTSRFAVHNEARIPPLAVVVKVHTARLMEGLIRREGSSEWLCDSASSICGGKLATA